MVNHICFELRHDKLKVHQFYQISFIFLSLAASVVSKRVYGVRLHETVTPSGNDGMESENDGIEEG